MTRNQLTISQFVLVTCWLSILGISWMVMLGNIAPTTTTKFFFGFFCGVGFVAAILQDVKYQSN